MTQAKKPKRSYNETLRIRYQVYKQLGYDSKTASFLSHRKLDVSELTLSKKTGKLTRNKVTKQYINVTMEKNKRRDYIDNHQAKVKVIANDTNYTLHGLLTHDKRYKGETGVVVHNIQRENKLSNDQAYYFFFYMTQKHLSYDDTKKELLSNRDFEEYDKNKKIKQDQKRQVWLEKKTRKSLGKWAV